MVSWIVNGDFRPSRGWQSGHLQTLRSRVVRRQYDLDAVGTQRAFAVAMNDGSGDRLIVQLHRSRTPRPAHSGLILLVHGLGGSAESSYVRACAYELLRVGYNVARVDLRGAGESAATCRLLYHAGRTQDLREVINALSAEPEAIGDAGQPARIAVMGFSLGGGMVLKLLGEPFGGPAPFAGIAVSAPLDLVAGSTYLRRSAFGVYEKFLVSGLKKQALQAAPDGSVRVSATEREAIRKARSLAEFDDALTAPRNGWKDSTEYYSVNSSNQFLDSIAVPTLVIHSLDDPMIAPHPYRATDWSGLAETGFVQRRITMHGGHVGFHEHDNHLPWFVGQAVEFLSRY